MGVEVGSMSLEGTMGGAPVPPASHTPGFQLLAGWALLATLVLLGSANTGGRGRRPKGRLRSRR